MRYAIVTDVHANWQAWSAVLKDIEKVGVDSILNLGDVIGYGPSPARVMDSAFQHCEHFILGNHDAVVGDRLDSDLFNDNAKYLIEWTRKQLSDEVASFFVDMPLSMEGPGFSCAHAELAMPGRFGYIYNAEDSLESFKFSESPLMFVGHTHQPTIFACNQNEASVQQIEAHDFVVQTDMRYLVNAGSVGDPRDGTVKATYIIYDCDTQQVIFRHIPFDTAAYRSDLEKAHLPTKNFFLSVEEGTYDNTDTLRDMRVSKSKMATESKRKPIKISAKKLTRHNLEAGHIRSQKIDSHTKLKKKKNVLIATGLIGFVLVLSMGLILLSHNAHPEKQLTEIKPQESKSKQTTIDDFITIVDDPQEAETPPDSKLAQSMTNAALTSDSKTPLSTEPNISSPPINKPDLENASTHKEPKILQQDILIDRALSPVRIKPSQAHVTRDNIAINEPSLDHHFISSDKPENVSWKLIFKEAGVYQVSHQFYRMTDGQLAKFNLSLDNQQQELSIGHKVSDRSEVFIIREHNQPALLNIDVPTDMHWHIKGAKIHFLKAFDAIADQQEPTKSSLQDDSKPQAVDSQIVESHDDFELTMLEDFEERPLKGWTFKSSKLYNPSHFSHEVGTTFTTRIKIHNDAFISTKSLKFKESKNLKMELLSPFYLINKKFLHYLSGGNKAINHQFFYQVEGSPQQYQLPLAEKKAESIVDLQALQGKKIRFTLKDNGSKNGSQYVWLDALCLSNHSKAILKPQKIEPSLTKEKNFARSLLKLNPLHLKSMSSHKLISNAQAYLKELEDLSELYLTTYKYFKNEQRSMISFKLSGHDFVYREKFKRTKNHQQFEFYDQSTLVKFMPFDLNPESLLKFYKDIHKKDFIYADEMKKYKSMAQFFHQSEFQLSRLMRKYDTEIRVRAIQFKTSSNAFSSPNEYQYDQFNRIYNRKTLQTVRVPNVFYNSLDFTMEFPMLMTFNNLIIAIDPKTSTGQEKISITLFGDHFKPVWKTIVQQPKTRTKTISLQPCPANDISQLPAALH